MPYIRLFSVPLPLDTKRRLAKDITEAVLRAMPGHKREWTPGHFTPYRPEDFATGGKLIIDGLSRDYFVEFASPNFPAEEMKAVVESLTPLLADALGVRKRDLKDQYQMQQLRSRKCAVRRYFVPIRKEIGDFAGLQGRGSGSGPQHARRHGARRQRSRPACRLTRTCRRTFLGSSGSLIAG